MTGATKYLHANVCASGSSNWAAPLTSDDDGFTGWCGGTHPGQSSYSKLAGDAIVAELGNGAWQQKDMGWRFKDLTLDECKEGCVALGDCAEMMVSSDGRYCYPATSACDGGELNSASKYIHTCGDTGCHPNTIDDDNGVSYTMVELCDDTCLDLGSRVDLSNIDEDCYTGIAGEFRRTEIDGETYYPGVYDRLESKTVCESTYFTDPMNNQVPCVWGGDGETCDMQTSSCPTGNCNYDNSGCALEIEPEQELCCTSTACYPCESLFSFY
jgi:hypothetical protein